MYLYCFILLVFFNVVICKDCITENFEHGFGNNLTNGVGRCIGREMWTIGQYSSVDVKSPHPGSTSFAQAQRSSGWTCMTSLKFNVVEGGTLEATTFALPITSSSIMWGEIFRVIPGREDVRTHVFRIWDSNLAGKDGWHTFSIQIPGSNTYEGYFLFVVTDHRHATLMLIDSFRYIAPSINKDSCVIYQDEETSTASTTTTTTTSPTTTIEEPTTTSTATEEPATQTTKEKPTTTTDKLCTTNLLPSTTAAVSTTEKFATTAVPSHIPRLSISLQKVRTRVHSVINAKIIKNFK